MDILVKSEGAKGQTQSDIDNKFWPCLTVWQVLLSEPEIDLHASRGGVKNSPAFLALHNRQEGIVQVSLASLLNQPRYDAAYNTPTPYDPSLFFYYTKISLAPYFLLTFSSFQPPSRELDIFL